jgi:protoporphyrin/coproporphyrin ferrochelatase
VFDALVLLSFGGPERREEVLPFLENVTRGRGVPPQRLAAVAEHYYHLGGASPINAQNRALQAAVQADLASHGVDLPVYWGNRNWHPLLADTVATMRADGVRRALVFTTSATSSYSGCRQYRENMAAARAGVDDAVDLVKLRHYFDHPGFITALADGVRAARTGVGANARLVCTAHSIPVAMNDSSGPSGRLYRAQHTETARLVAESVFGPAAGFDLAWQSRSGSPQVPWLEPDVNDHLRALAAAGVQDVIVAPTGFVSDHVEVAWDLDVEARATAGSLGMGFARAATPGTHPAFVAMVRELVAEQLDAVPPRTLGGLGICGVACPDWCCSAPIRGPVKPS